MMSTTTAVTNSAPEQWWQQRTLPEGQVLHCRLGPLNLSVWRSDGEWRMAWDREPEGEDRASAILELEAVDFSPDEFERHVFARATGKLQLRPGLLDRAVVARPVTPLFIPAGESTTLYLSTPLSIFVDVEELPVTLREIPVLRLSDTWFGPNSRQGDLCYAVRTRARHRLEEVPRRAHRAISAVRIENKAETALPLEKLSLPIPALSLYGATDGSLWTQSLALTRTQDSDLAAMTIDRLPPAAAGATEMLSEPREPSQRGTLVRAFSLFFGD